MLNNKTRTQAFSLIETLIAITIAAIVLLIATPSWRRIISKNHALAYANELVIALQFTRAAAIKFGEPVKLCARDGLWRNGSIIATEEDEKVIRILPPIFTKDKLSWNGGLSITFSPAGFSNGQQGSFYYCPHGFPEHATAVILSPAGSARISSKTYDEKTIPCNF